MTPATFFVSTGRTGTSFLAQLFESLGARSSHEPGPRWLRLLSNAHVAGAVGTPRAAQVLTRVRREELSPDGPPYVESSCLVYGLVTPLLEAFPSGSVVHVVRDPRTYVQSGLSWGAYRTGGRVLNVVPFRRLAPPQFDPWSVQARVDWARQGQLERLCWAWTNMNKAMREQGGAAGGAGRFRTIRFEDLFDEATAVPVLRSLCDVVGVRVPSDDELAASARTQVNASKQRPSARWDDWDEAQRRHLSEACGEEAARYGYDLTPAAA